MTFEKLAADAVLMTTVVVSPVGPTAADNCAALRAALDGITDNDVDTRYLIYLEPGVYDCGTATLFTKAYVSLRGAGQRATEINGAVNGADGLVQVLDNSELSHLTVENTSTGATAVGVRSTASTREDQPCDH